MARIARRRPVTEEGNLRALSQRLGHPFRDRELLRQALTHPSIAGSRASGGGPSYQRLEFLGDRVLGLLISDLLYRRFPRESEGDLARRLTALVREETLAEVATRIDLGSVLRLGKAEDEAGERANPALLADACEAVIGALYIDGGLDAARAFVVPNWTPIVAAERQPPQDAKSALQEWAQGRGLPLPVYVEVAREGSDHDPHFTIEVSIKDQPPERGDGKSKRLAEQAAAASLLARLTGKGT